MDEVKLLYAFILIFVLVVLALFIPVRSKKKDDESEDFDEQLGQYTKIKTITVPIFNGYNQLEGFSFEIENKTSEIHYTGLLVKKNVNQNLSVKLLDSQEQFCDFYEYISVHHQYVKKVRLYTNTAMPWWTNFRLETKLPNQHIGRTLFIPFDIFSQYQQQSTIVEKLCNFQIDNLTTDIHFKVNPGEKIYIDVFYEKEEGEIEQNAKMFKDWIEPVRICGVVIENKTDENQQIELFNYEKFESEYSKNSQLSISNIHEDFGYKQTCDEIRLQGDYKCNHIKAFSLNGSQIVQDIVLKKGDESESKLRIVHMAHSVSAYQNQLTLTTCKVDEFIMSEMEFLPTVTVLPKTKVAYVFSNIPHKNNEQ